MARFNYIELPVAETGRSKQFYAAAFGWAFTDFGPTYAATMTGDTDIGFQGDREQVTAVLLPVIDVPDLETALAQVQAAGATITMSIFAFPGGRRFHFRDPDGHEIGVVQANAAE